MVDLQFSWRTSFSSKLFNLHTYLLEFEYKEIQDKEEINSLSHFAGQNEGLHFLQFRRCGVIKKLKLRLNWTIFFKPKKKNYHKIISKNINCFGLAMNLPSQLCCMFNNSIILCHTLSENGLFSRTLSWNLPSLHSWIAKITFSKPP